ncbi:hypothetical protein SDC9_180937 [bioreactor metagenome]|uniref:Uncharacterized protein n=1 Tax=bioreactor metagenome TaxID=1076179 RepID=A0A645H5U7_9ZZZZ
MDGQVFLKIIYIKYGFGRIFDLPNYIDANFHRIAQLVINLLLIVSQGQSFQREFLASDGIVISPAAMLAYRYGIDLHFNQGFGRRVDAAAKRIDPIETFFAQSTVIFAKQGQYQSFIGINNF